jgi:putative transposase
MARGFLYLVVVMDWVSRAVLPWRVSNTLGADFCVETLAEALVHYGRPEIFDTDQGCQFTSTEFTALLEQCGITISMDGKGRYMDYIFIERLWRSLKYEEVYLNAYATVTEAKAGIGAWLSFYNDGHQHQSLGYRTPRQIYQKGLWIWDDRRCRPAPFPPLPEQARKAGECSPSPTYPQAPLPTKDLILMKGTEDTPNQPSRSLRSEPQSKSVGLRLKTRLRLPHVRGPPYQLAQLHTSYRSVYLICPPRR